MRRVFILIFLVSGLPAISTAQPAVSHAEQASEEGDNPQKLDAMMTRMRDRNASDYAVTSLEGIDEARYVRLGGIEQWITIRGEDRRNPVLLFLHGGPGDVINPWAYAGFRSWLRAFTVVHWDQRGAGRTRGKNGPTPAGSLTIERMTQDGIELAEWLCQRLSKDRILLVGHSWGSVLGVFMAKERPDLFAAFVGTGQVADSSSNGAVVYAELLKKAEALRESDALQELNDVGPPPYSNGRGYAVQRKWSNRFEGADLFLASTLGLAMTAPGYSTKDITDWFEGQYVRSDQLAPGLTRETLSGQFRVPVIVIQGAEDFTTSTSLARDFVNAIRAPQKEFVSIEDGGHFAVFMESDTFLRILVSRVRSLIQ